MSKQQRDHVKLMTCERNIPRLNPKVSPVSRAMSVMAASIRMFMIGEGQPERDTRAYFGTRNKA